MGGPSGEAGEQCGRVMCLLLAKQDCGALGGLVTHLEGRRGG
jgi:hypothetical protein